MNEFREWMTAMGYHGKQVTKAGERIGMGRSSALLGYRGERRLTKTELLAMAATVSGCSEWSATNHAKLVASSMILRSVEGFYSA